MRLAFDETIYKRAVDHVWAYFDGHSCGESDLEGKDGAIYSESTLSDEYLERAYSNPNPTPEDIGIIQEHLIEMTDYLHIEEDAPYDPEDERPYEINLIIKLLESEKGSE